MSATSSFVPPGISRRHVAFGQEGLDSLRGNRTRRSSPVAASTLTGGDHTVRDTVQRVDAIVALAQKIQASTAASDAAALVSQLVSLTNELVVGKDDDADGKVTWKDREGGLQQCEEHVMLLIAGEKAPGRVR